MPIRRMPATEYALGELPPSDWAHIARFLRGVLTPLVDVPGWEAERLVLGAFAAELAMNAREAGEPDPGTAIVGNREQRLLQQEYVDYIDRITRFGWEPEK